LVKYTCLNVGDYGAVIFFFPKISKKLFHRFALLLRNGFERQHIFGNISRKLAAGKQTSKQISMAWAVRKSP
jgi:hypothetical protein